jgi:phage gpG-like protein
MSNTNVIAKRLEKVRRDLLVYRQQWPAKAGSYALKWVQGNFELQGWRGNTLVPWARRKSRKQGVRGKFQGVLRDSTKSRLMEQSGKLKNSIKMLPMKEAAKIYTFCKYARAHNDGFKGTVQVRAFNRRKKLVGTIEGLGGEKFNFGAASSLKTHRRVKDKPVFDKIPVKAHARHMNLPRRQFMPSAKRQSPMLNKEVRNMTQNDIQKILKTAR